MTDLNMYRPYKYYEQVWNATKPIRGRSGDIRPIGKRRRDWETVVRMERDGVVCYGAKLYDTICVEYFPDDTMIIRSGGWVTPSTAEFINTHGFRCWRQHNKLWVQLREGEEVVPLAKEGVKFARIDGKWQLAEPIVIQKSVIDRQKAKEAREPLKPFINFAKTFLALSDGWIMHETAKQVLGWKGDKPEDYGYALRYVSERDLFNKLRDNPSEEACLFALCCFAYVGGTPAINMRDKRLAVHYEYELELNNGRKLKTGTHFYDVRLSFDNIKRTIHKWVDTYDDVRKIIEVAPGKCAIRGVR